MTSWFLLVLLTYNLMILCLRVKGDTHSFAYIGNDSVLLKTKHAGFTSPAADNRKGLSQLQWYGKPAVGKSCLRWDANLCVLICLTLYMWHNKYIAFNHFDEHAIVMLYSEHYGKKDWGALAEMEDKQREELAPESSANR